MNDDDLGINNIMPMMVTEKYDYEEMRAHIIKMTAWVDKGRHKIVKRFGVYWYERLNDEDWKKTHHRQFVRVDGIHTKEQLIEFGLK